MFSQWIKFSSELLQAQCEAQRVIGLRLSVLASGGTDAASEWQLMFLEKFAANADAAVALAGGESPQAIVGRYRTIMRANERRLGRNRQA